MVKFTEQGKNGKSREEWGVFKGRTPSGVVFIGYKGHTIQRTEKECEVQE
jgi:hypothetical protein